MKRANIVTLDGYKNYGNRLQNYALSITLNKLGVESSTPWIDGFKKRIKTALKVRTPLALLYKKERKLYKFTKKYNKRKVFNKENDYTIFGSDQVWNPEGMRFRIDNIFNNKNIISYAPSLGVDALTETQKERFREGLKKFKAISIREESSLSLLQPLTDKKIYAVLDPTLLLEKEEYCKIEKKPKNIKVNDEYILCYILGDRAYDKDIEEFAKTHNLKTIYFSDKKDSMYGVEEFLYLIDHAKLICTDSFHACVFSFIFERPFVVFRRRGELDKMYGRIADFLEKFKIDGVEFDGYGISEKSFVINYANGKIILKNEQKKSLIYLKKALDFQNEE